VNDVHGGTLMMLAPVETTRGGGGDGGDGSDGNDEGLGQGNARRVNTNTPPLAVVTLAHIKKSGSVRRVGLFMMSFPHPYSRVR